MLIIALAFAVLTIAGGKFWHGVAEQSRWQIVQALGALMVLRDRLEP